MSEEPPEDVVRALCAWVGPEVPEAEVRAAVARLRARKAVQRVTVMHVQWKDGQDASEGAQGRLERQARRIAGADAAQERVDAIADALASKGFCGDEDLAVECACGTIWPDGVTGKGHGDMWCEGYEV